MGTSTASKPLNSFIIVIYDLGPTYSFLLLFYYYVFRNGHINHFTDLLNDLLNIIILQTLTRYVI